MKNDEEQLRIIRKIVNKPEASQEELAEDLGFSLGKLNYCLNELKKKGLIKVNNFKKSQKNLAIFTH